MTGVGTEEAMDPTSGVRLTRRQLVAAAGASVVAASLSPVGANLAHAAARKSAGSLNLFTWANYFDPANLKAFSKKTGIKVNVTTYDSNDAAFAKLNITHGGGFDLVIPTSDWVPVMAGKGLLAKLDRKRIPWQLVDKELLGKNFDPHNTYSVPKDYGFIGVVYDPAATGEPIKTWADFLRVGAKPGVSGKVIIPQVPDDTLGIALWSKNQNWNTTSKDELNAAGEVMKAFAKNVKSFNGFDSDSVANGSVVMAAMTQGTSRLAMQQNKKLKFVVPQPHSELWVDNYCLVANGKNSDAAYTFMNFFLQPAQQLKDCAYIGYPTALPHLESKLPKSVPLRQTIFAKKSDFKRLIPHVIHTENQSLVENLMSQIQAAATG